MPIVMNLRKYSFSAFARRRAIEERQERAAKRALLAPPKKPSGRPPVHVARAIDYCVHRIKRGDREVASKFSHVEERRVFSTKRQDKLTAATTKGARRRNGIGAVKYSLYREWFPLVLAAFLAGPNAGTPGAKYRPGETVKIGNADLI